MFFDQNFSSIGRATGALLDNLRSQLGEGIDPAFDKEKLRAETARKIFSVEESEPDFIDLDEIRDNIAELHGGQVHGGHRHAGISAAKERQRPHSATSSVGASVKGAAASTLGGTSKAGAAAGEGKGSKAAAAAVKRPASAILSRGGRDDRKNAAESSAGPGMYKPNWEIGMPRVITPVPFGTAKCAIGRSLPENLSDTGMEVGDVIQKPERKTLVLSMAKQVPRGTFYTVTDHVDEHRAIEDPDKSWLKSSNAHPPPCFSISNSRVSGHDLVLGQQGSEPGQYDVQDHLVRPRSGGRSIDMRRQLSRRPFSAPSLTPAQDKLCLAERPACVSDERRVAVPDLSKYTERPDILPPRRDFAEAPEMEVLERAENQCSNRRRPRTADSFAKSLTRQQHLRSMRIYGADFAAQKIRENLEDWDEALRNQDANEGADIEGKPAQEEELCWDPFPHHVVVPIFDSMPGRKAAGQFADPPARHRISKASSCGQFQRPSRVGEARCQALAMSQASAAIAELRATRSYKALPKEEFNRCLEARVRRRPARRAMPMRELSLSK